MSMTQQRCPYIIEDEFERLECDHPVYKNHKHCVFHSDQVEDKASDFYKAFAKWIVLCTQKLDVIDLRGFVLPELKLEDIIFEKMVDFRGARFRGNVLLQKVAFAQGADFSKCIFERKLMVRNISSEDTMRFQGTEFEDDISVAKCSFKTPAIFREARFLKIADFNETLFEDDVDFMKAFFSSKANFVDARMKKGAEFSESVFADVADFSKCKFDQSTDFRGTHFKGDTSFHASRFSELASFWMSTFSGNAILSEANFAGNAIFWMSDFEGIADFRKTSFQQRAEFKGATFHNELMLNQSRLQFLKELDAAGVDMEGTILNASQFWGVTRLEGYSFRDAVLLANNFSGKEFIDCDFTGATFDAVNTRDWTIDDATISKTKYIFTNYVKESELDEYGEKRDIYKPIEDSRIPATGNFNEGVNKGFTLNEVFKQWKHKYVLFETPKLLHGPMMQYMGMFSAFVRSVYKEDVLALCHPEGENLRVHLHAANPAAFSLLDARVSEFLKEVFLKDHITLDVQLEGIERELALHQFTTAIEFLHTSITMLLTQGSDDVRKSVLDGLSRLVRDWEILSPEVSKGDEQLHAFLAEAFQPPPPPPPSEPVIVEVPVESKAPAETVAPTRQMDLDTFIEVKFSFDDLEDVLLRVKDAIPTLAVKINGIQREINRVRDEKEDEKLLNEQQVRITKIVQRTESLVPEGSAGESNGEDLHASVDEVCKRIYELIH